MSQIDQPCQETMQHTSWKTNDTDAPRASTGIHIAKKVAKDIAPLWPLENFVATNPFVGLTSQPFDKAGSTLHRTGLGDSLMPTAYYVDQINEGRILDADLESACEHYKLDSDDYTSLSGLSETLINHSSDIESPYLTIAEVVGDTLEMDLESASTDQISEWAAAYFDEGQAIWESPFRSESPYAAWHSEFQLDLSIDALGLGISRDAIAALPNDPRAVIGRLSEFLQFDDETFALYLQRLTSSIAGWIGHARYKDWSATLANGEATNAFELLAIRAAWELLFLRLVASKPVRAALHGANSQLACREEPLNQGRLSRLVAHEALENAARRELFDGAFSSVNSSVSKTETKPSIQAVFCIDVRSERLRRAVEQFDNSIETLGFAGFFGMPLEVLTIDRTDADAQCPVLLEPQFKVRESGHSVAATQVLHDKISDKRQADAAWQMFHGSAISSFAYVESLGLKYVWNMISENLKRVFVRSPQKELAPRVTIDESNVSELERYRDGSADLAESILRGMSLTEDFAPLVALIGHGSTASNNPYASRYHCGACGGHSGDANARMAAALLNDTFVRRQLRSRGIEIPESTQFVAGLHDTATDEVRLLDIADLPNADSSEVNTLQTVFDYAATTVRRNRATDHGLSLIDDDALLHRSQDWAEVRPEWGLVGCQGFIAAPRDVTKNSNLHGRCFLHNYNWQTDDNFEVLELIMTAPLVVASWISLQYYASTVDNQRLGSGDKTIHNVVGGLGVLEGTGGDLRVGLPWQSIHDGEVYLHEPLRLNAIIAAPTDAISGILLKHQQVRDLFDNHWLHLYARSDSGVLSQYVGNLKWQEVNAAGARQDASGLLRNTA